MNIELRFLQKAIDDKNYISFSYENRNFKKVKPLSLKALDEKYLLNSDAGNFEFEKIAKLKILKIRF